MALTNPNAAGNEAGATLGSLTHDFAHRWRAPDMDALPSWWPSEQ